MVKIRMQRFGKQHRPYYRIVAADSRSPRDGKFLEVIGTYQPIEKEPLKIDEEKALKWLANGAQPSDTVRSLFTKLGLIEKFYQQKK